MVDVSTGIWCVENHVEKHTLNTYLGRSSQMSDSDDYNENTDLLDMMAREYEYDVDPNDGETTEFEPLINNSTLPKDRFYTVFGIFAFLGLASLLPWNFFITAKKYFDYKLRNTSLPSNVSFDDPTHATAYQAEFESYLSIVSNGCNLLFSFITVLIVRAVSVRKRIIVSSAFILLIFVATTVMVKINSDAWEERFLIFTLTIAALVSAAQSVLTSSVLGLSAIFPPIYSQSAMNGQAIGGTFSAVVSILTKWAGGDAISSAFIYFTIAFCTTIVAILAYLSLHGLKFSMYYFKLQDALFDGHTSIKSLNNDYTLEAKESRSLYYWRIFKKIWQYCLSTGLVFFVTLSVFPSVCASIKSYSTDKNWTGYFTSVVCFLLFNVGDFLGRSFTFVCKFPGNHRPYLLMVFTFMRLAFIPLLMFCNAQPRYHIPVYLDSDAYPIVFILAMGLSNGYLSTLCMSFGPVHVTESEAEVAGIMLAISMTVGLAAGSFLSIGLVKLL